jgi:hypothetical protein
MVQHESCVNGLMNYDDHDDHDDEQVIRMNYKLLSSQKTYFLY